MGNLSSHPPLSVVEELPAASSTPPSPNQHENKRQKFSADSQSFATAMQSLSQLSVQGKQLEQNGESLRVISSSDSDIMSYSADRLALSQQAERWAGFFTGTNQIPALFLVDQEDDRKEMTYLSSFGKDGETLEVCGDSGLGEIASFISKDNISALMDHASYNGQTDGELPSVVTAMMSKLEVTDQVIEVQSVPGHSLRFTRVDGGLQFTLVR